MLSAIAGTTLLDDVYSEDTTTLQLEKYMADLTGHEAALFVPSGTMGNQIAIRTHISQPPCSILCDARAHILRYEAGGTTAWSGALITPVSPRNTLYLCAEDIESHIMLSSNVHMCPTKLVCLENTIDGLVTPLDELQRISTFCRRNSVPVHMDGARLWEAAAATNLELSDFASLCDSVSLCFSKGLGAPIGSILVGRAEFINKARHLRKAFGGGMRQAGVLTAAAMIAVNKNFATDHGARLRQVHRLTQEIADKWEALGGCLLLPVHTNMVWLDLERIGCTAAEFIAHGKTQAVKFSGGRLVVHYQTSEAAVETLFSIFDKILRHSKCVAAH